MPAAPPPGISLPPSLRRPLRQLLRQRRNGHPHMRTSRYSFPRY